MTNFERRRPETGPPWVWGAAALAIIVLIAAFGWRNGWYSPVPPFDTVAHTANAPHAPTSSSPGRP